MLKRNLGATVALCLAPILYAAITLVACGILAALNSPDVVVSPDAVVDDGPPECHNSETHIQKMGTLSRAFRWGHACSCVPTGGWGWRNGKPPGGMTVEEYTESENKRLANSRW